MRNVSAKSCRGNQNIRFMLNNFFLLKIRQTTYDNIIRRLRFTCWITKATDTHSEYLIFSASSLQESLRERASVLRLDL